MAHISIVIPGYKAEACLVELYRQLKGALEPLTQDFEILLVEDCGGDRSWQIIEDLARHDTRVKGLQFSRNFGQHYGITAGLDHCDGDWVIVEDRKTADNGDMVIALVGGQDVTLKKFYKEANRIRLQPANPSMLPIYVEPDGVQIQGVVVGVMRKY